MCVYKFVDNYIFNKKNIDLLINKINNKIEVVCGDRLSELSGF